MTLPELLQLSSSYWSTCALHAGVKLDLFTPLARSPLTAASLAQKLLLDQRGLAMLLHALVALDLLTKDEDQFTATAFAAQYLSKDSPEYSGYIILHHQALVEGWSRLDEAVRSGAPVRKRTSHDASIQERESFLMGMFNLASQLAPRIAGAIDLSGCSRLLDLAGGPGTYAIHFCKANPELSALIFDLPTTRPFAEQVVRRFDLSHRITFAAGDITIDPLDGTYDAVWISHLLHSEGPESCAAIIAKAAQALAPGGRLLIQEFLLDDNRTSPLFPTLFSLNMLIGNPNGQAYAQGELAAMMAQAGLTQVHRLPLDLPNGAGIMMGRQ